MVLALIHVIAIVKISKLDPNYTVRFVHEIHKPKEFEYSRTFRARRRNHPYGEHSKRAKPVPPKRDARIHRDFGSE